MPPRVDTIAITGLTTTDAGMLAYNTPDDQLYIWTGSTWQALQTAASVTQIWDDTNAPDIGYNAGNVWYWHDKPCWSVAS